MLDRINEITSIQAIEEIIATVKGQDYTADYDAYRQSIKAIAQLEDRIIELKFSNYRG